VCPDVGIGGSGRVGLASGDPAGAGGEDRPEPTPPAKCGMNPLVHTLAILGPGLLGGSLAGAVRRSGLARQTRVWGRRRAGAEAVVARGWADLATDDVAEAVEGADFIVLATPVGVMPELAARIVEVRDRLADGVVVTDVGSVKGFVAERVAPVLDAAGVTFVGSHPMAGAETAGFEAARDTLFDGAACILTPHADTLPVVRAFWERLGCRLVTMTPAAHDAVVARISHVPHVAASAVVLAGLAGDPESGLVAGRGFRDTTRVASGDAALWTEILLENRGALERPLADLIGRLGEVLDFVRRSDDVALRQFLAEAKALRDRAVAAADTRSHG
jgi:prephenate dehydrogenase